MYAVTPEVWGSENLMVHSGMGTSATTVYDRVKDIIERHTASGHSVVVVGHSLGAGVAALLSWLLRERYACHLISFHSCMHE